MPRGVGWVPLVPRSPLTGDAQHVFQVASELLCTHVRLRIYPDGGVARLRVHGTSITALVPINNRIASWAEVTPPADWKTFRRRWDVLHRWRVVLLTTAFAFLIVGVVTK